MIIRSGIQIKDYQQNILDNKYGFHGGEASRGMFRCPNPDCRCDRFYRHGTYERYFISAASDFKLDDIPASDDTLTCLDGIQTQLLTILRVKCTGCGQTHAILPEDIVPFHPFSLLLLLTILVQICKTDNDNSSGKRELHQTKFLSWSFLHTLLLVYQLYYTKMLHALRIKGIYTRPENPSDRILLGFYITEKANAKFHFREIFSSQLFLTRQNTVSYPIRIIIC